MVRVISDALLRASGMKHVRSNIEKNIVPMCTPYNCCYFDSSSSLRSILGSAMVTAVLENS